MIKGPRAKWAAASLEMGPILYVSFSCLIPRAAFEATASLLSQFAVCIDAGSDMRFLGWVLLALLLLLFLHHLFFSQAIARA